MLPEFKIVTSISAMLSIVQSGRNINFNEQRNRISNLTSWLLIYLLKNTLYGEVQHAKTL